MRTRRRPTLAGQLLVLQLAIVVVVLIAVAAVSLAQSAATFNRVEGRRVTALAEQLATSPLLRDRLATTTPGESVTQAVITAQTQSGVSTVSVADMRGVVVASTNPTLVGSRMTYGDPDAARGWSGTLHVDRRRQLVAQVPVIGAELPTATSPGNVGKLLGTVMVGEASPSVWKRL
ncbi:MAG TPA: hypothetical protein VEK80_01610, partial [Kribbellaceae bacterium]|nr:hypothetical protein [Kribbellaceae bacterium]